MWEMYIKIYIWFFIFESSHLGRKLQVRLSALSSGRHCVGPRNQRRYYYWECLPWTSHRHLWRTSWSSFTFNKQELSQLEHTSAWYFRKWGWRTSLLVRTVWSCCKASQLLRFLPQSVFVIFLYILSMLLTFVATGFDRWLLDIFRDRATWVGHWFLQASQTHWKLYLECTSERDSISLDTKVPL